MATAITDSRCSRTRAYHPTLAASCIKHHAKACMEAVPPVRPAVTPISVVTSLTVASGTTVASHRDSPLFFTSLIMTACPVYVTGNKLRFAVC